MRRRNFLTLAATYLGAVACKPSGDDGKKILRVGHFPNITHAQGVIAHQLSLQGKGWFEERLGKEIKIEWFIYNAGPSAIEAMFAGSLDLSYIGPNPVLNGYTKTKGADIRVVAGATNGGAALVVQGDSTLAKPEDFRGKKIATPQFGNTQDVACRVWLNKHGIKVTQIGGDAQVLPTANPDQLSLFQSKDLDAVWTVEPWVSRLEMEAGGKVFLEQKADFATVVAASVDAVEGKAELVKKFVKAHEELTQWIVEHPEEAKELVRAGIKEFTKRDLPKALADKAWPRLVFTSKVELAGFQQVLEEAQSVNLLKDAPPLDKLLAVPQ